MGKMATPASARGSAIEATIPVSSKSIGPSSLSNRQPGWLLTFSGTCFTGQTMDNSSDVRVIEKKEPSNAQAGAGTLHSSRQIANCSSSNERVRKALGIGYCLFYPSNPLSDSARFADSPSDGQIIKETDCVISLCSDALPGRTVVVRVVGSRRTNGQQTHR